MSQKQLLLVTGASGFVGRALVRQLRDNGYAGRSAIRNAQLETVSTGWKNIVVGDINDSTDWSKVLEGVDTVVHLAARVHVLNEVAIDPLSEYCATNVRGTEHLARQSADLGVRRFIYLSSIKVNGESTDGRVPFSLDDRPTPEGAYGISKCCAEDALREISAESGLEVVIIRPPLVYGPEVKANFLSMMRWINRSVPLPLGAINNRRSLVALDNLVDLILTCIEAPAAANQTFLVSDDEDLSTTELLQRMAIALGKPARLMPVPVWLLKFGMTLVGKRHIAQRLVGSLQVDISKTKETLGWSPPLNVNDALKKTAEDFLARQ